MWRSNRRFPGRRDLRCDRRRSRLLLMGVNTVMRLCNTPTTGITLCTPHPYPLHLEHRLPPTKMPAAWKRLIRFIATDGRVFYGEPLLPAPGFDFGQSLNGVKLEAQVVQGQDIYDTTGAKKVTDEVAVVKKILGPVTSRDVPVLQCIGLNCAADSVGCLVSSHTSNS